MSKSKGDYDYRKVDSLLNHVNRICQKPIFPTELRNNLGIKLNHARRSLKRKDKVEEVTRPLHEMQHILETQSTDVCEKLKDELRLIHNIVKSNSALDYKSKLIAFLMDPTTRDTKSEELKKRVGEAEKHLKLLKEMNEIKLEIRKTAGIVQKGGFISKEEIQKIVDNLGRNAEQIEILETALNFVKTTEQLRNLPKIIDKNLKVTMSRTQRILLTHSGGMLLIDHLKNLQEALEEKNYRSIIDTLEIINTEIDNIDRDQTASAQLE